MRPPARLIPPSPPERRGIERVLSLLGRGVLAFHPRLVRLTGSVGSALMLSQSLYWTRIMATRGERHGWFWKRRGDWGTEIALSRHEQDAARRRLASLPFWQEKRAGMPARMWYRIDLDLLAQSLDRDFSGRWDWRDEIRLAGILGRPLLVFRALADLTRSVTAAILLSRLLAEERIRQRGADVAHRNDRYGHWHRYDHGRILAITGLSRAECYAARAALRSAGFITERRIGIPPRSEWRIDFGHLIAALETLTAERADWKKTPDQADAWIRARNMLHRTNKAGESAGGIIPNGSNNDGNRPETRVNIQYAENHILDCGNPHTGNPKTGQLEIRKAANWKSGKRPTRWTVSGQSESRIQDFLEEGITGKPITSESPPPTPSSVPPESVPERQGGGGSDFPSLIWPPALLVDERPVAACLFREGTGAIPPQVLLDELHGYALHHNVRQPLAYLRHLAEQARSGQFVPLVAVRVAAARDRAQAMQRQVQTALPPKAITELSAEERSARRHALEQWRTFLRAGAGSRPFATNFIKEP